MKAAFEQIFNGSLVQNAIGAAYDPTKINRGKHTGQYNLGPGDTDKFIGPNPLSVGNFGESQLAIPANMLHPVKITDDLFWVFAGDAASAAATRRVQLWTWIPSTNTYNFIGGVTLTFPTATVGHVVRGIRALLTNITTGTVTVSGTGVTGSSTTWATTSAICVGSRIGFGSTDPNQITEWFQITAVGSDTSITLNRSAGTIASGTPYVIQDLMIITATTNTTVTNGGLFVAKGLQYADFQSPLVVIPSATTVDRIKAVYWLKDAATITNTAIGGCAIDDPVSMTEQYTYCTNGAATALIIYRYNFRAPLTSLSAGAQVLTGSNVVITGTATVPGNISQANNGRVATLTHGPGNGIPSLYLFTATRIIRVPLSNVTQGAINYIADQMSETPPGGTQTNLATAGFSSMDVAGSLDKLVISAASGTGTIYITDYYTGSQQLDRRASSLSSQTPSGSRDLETPLFVHSIGSSAPFLWVEDGWLFWMYGAAAATAINAVTVYPLAADFGFLAEVPNRIICPKIDLGSNPVKFYRAFANCVENLGDDFMGVTPDMYRMQYRTNGIDDNTGVWIDVPQNGDISGAPASENIQFAFLFRTCGTIMLPARITGLAVIYESLDDLPSQYRWNFADFSLSNGTFAWIQTSLFGTSLGTHTINIYRADTNALVLTQPSTSTTNGNFQYWNGTSWVSGLGTDAINTRRRFVPTGSLPASVDLYATLTVS